MPPHTPQSRMRAVAERQSGVVAFRQLIDAGFSVAEIRTMITRGQLLRIYRGVYALGHRRLTMRGRLFAASLSAGDGAFLSHRTGAAVRGLRSHPPVIELTVPASCTPPPHDDLRIHRTTIPVDHTQAVPRDGLLVATVPRIIIDLAQTERPGEIQRLIRRSIQSGQFDLAAMRRAVDHQPGRPGTRLARLALARYVPGSEDRRSWLEHRFQAHQRNDPRLPTPVYNAQLHGYEIDALWPGPRVTLELDGRPYHTAVEDFDRDRAKDRTLIRHGWRPLRISDLEWEHDRARVLEDLYAVLGT
jgi:very-short-patch-repair endonuclease